MLQFLYPERQVFCWVIRSLGHCNDISSVLQLALALGQSWKRKKRKKRKPMVSPSRNQYPASRESIFLVFWPEDGSLGVFAVCTYGTVP